MLPIASAVVSVGALVYGVVWYRGANLNGHRWLATLGLVAMTSIAAASVLVLFVSPGSRLFLWFHSWVRLNQSFSAIVLTVMIRYFAPSHDDSRVRRDARNGRSGRRGLVGHQASEPGVGRPV